MKGDIELLSNEHILLSKDSDEINYDLEFLNDFS